jgi:hypothetical protein
VLIVLLLANLAHGRTYILRLSQQAPRRTKTGGNVKIRPIFFVVIGKCALIGVDPNQSIRGLADGGLCQHCASTLHA